MRPMVSAHSGHSSRESNSAGKSFLRTVLSLDRAACAMRCLVVSGVCVLMHAFSNHFESSRVRFCTLLRETLIIGGPPDGELRLHTPGGCRPPDPQRDDAIVEGSKPLLIGGYLFLWAVVRVLRRRLFLTTVDDATVVVRARVFRWPHQFSVS